MPKPLAAALFISLGLSAADRVDFHYAFAPPHRITIARPSSSVKTLLDLEPGAVTLAWTFDDLLDVPLAVWKPPQIRWRVQIVPLLDGRRFPRSTWTRGESSLPLLDNLYQSPGGEMRLEAIGAASGALLRITARNLDSQSHRFSLQSELKTGWVVHNPAWIEPGRNPDALLAMQQERADRVLLFGVGASSFPIDKKTLTLEWNLTPGETADGWLIRPARSYEKDLPALRSHSWTAEFDAAKAEWRALLARAARIQLPDTEVQTAFYASLADLFIMREPLASGYLGGICGTEIYRSTNPFEPSLVAIALDQLGLHDEAADGLRVHLDMQEPTGEWADPRGWANHMWGASGMKAWAGMEHFRLTGDRAYLAQLYPHLLANSRWQHAQRALPQSGGLMPRGMGDGGLMRGSDYFGVFFPHNILAVFADRLAVEAAKTLDRRQDIPELTRIYETARDRLRAALEHGALSEPDYRWVPGSAGDPSGSRWGALYAAYPAAILDPFHPLITGTLRKIESAISPGGQPIHTGWMADGAWVAITLDNIAETHLLRDEGDNATAYLYSSLNHATPLYTWCEERGLDPATSKTSGDRQHLWTPLAVVRFLRDALVMEQDGNLHLARATARSWLERGKAVTIQRAPTHFGDVSYSIESRLDRNSIRVRLDPPRRQPPAQIILHVRHPLRSPMRGVTLDGQAWTSFDPAAETIRLTPPEQPVTLEIRY